MEELIKRIVARDEEALNELYRAMHHRIVAFAMQRLGDTGLAEEVMLETLFEVWTHAPRYAHESQASTWILGIARHKALDKLRKLRQGKPWLEEMSDEHLEIASAEMAGVERVLQAERSAALHNCIKELPPVQRECLHLVFYQEFALEDIARLQDCPPNTVKTRLFHARRKLRACLDACGHGDLS